MGGRADTCAGSGLPDLWWRDGDTLKREYLAHGSLRSAAQAHGVSHSSLAKWWRRCRLGDVPTPRGSSRAEGVPAEKPLDVTDVERIRRDQLEAEVAYLRRENRRYAKELANREAVVERIIEAGRVPVIVPDYRVARQDRSRPERSVVLPIYDVQYGQLVRPTDTPLNAGGFDSSVFDTRLARWLEATTGSIRDYAASHRVTEAVIVLGGDLVEGADVFKGQAWQLERDPARQVVELREKLGEALRLEIRFLKEEIGVSRIMMLVIPGNHGKVGGRQAGATPATMSWDWLLAEWLRDRLRAEPIDVWGIEPGGALLFETLDRLFLAIHGDEIRGWGGLPFYGMTRYDGRAMRLTGEVFDYVLLGHHHQPASIPNGSGGEFIVSGDWVGANNLSRTLGAASTPQQRLLFVSRRYGITEQVPIYLAPPKRDPPRIYAAA